MLILGFLILFFGVGCFALSGWYFIKYLWYYKKSDKPYTKFLIKFNKEYKDIIK